MRQGYGQFCPVALASELLAERWTLLIVRELLAGAQRFNEIRRGVPRLSPTLLRQRLQSLELAGVLERQPRARGRAGGYRLTGAGRALKPVVVSIGEWGQRWARDIRPDDLDPGWLVWGMHRRLNLAAMPPGRTVIEIEFTDAPRTQRRFWLVHCAGEVQVCLKDPGYEIAVHLAARVRALAEVWRGIRSLREALGSGAIRVSGATHYRRALPHWLLLSSFAAIRRERGAARAQAQAS
jgi:DNA-binding HxlR family transcriptional regulator